MDETNPNGDDGGLRPPNKFRQLPEPVRLEDTVATHDAEPVPDPQAGQDSERDFMLRYSS